VKWRSLAESASLEMRSLRDVLDERKELMAKYVPADVRAVHERAVRELRDSGISQKALRVGSKAPEFELPDQNGKTLSLSRLLQQGRVVVCFVRGRWCPFCVAQTEAMEAIHAQILSAGAVLVAISPQSVHQSFLMADQHHLGFPLLSDAENRVAAQFGLSYRVPEYQQEIYQQALINLPFINGDPSWNLPVPACYVLDRDRTVLYAAVDPDYTARPEPTDILALLSQLL
jgi:peroxiredoxin